jgi:hypothetical protein
MRQTSLTLKVVIYVLAVVATGCDPLIKVRGNVDELLSAESLSGQVAGINQRAVPGVKVVLRAKENSQRGFKAFTNEKGAYEISGIITALKSGWNWSEGWEIVFEKEGYETTVVELDPKKHKDAEGNLKWQYRVDVVLSPRK